MHGTTVKKVTETLCSIKKFENRKSTKKCI